MHDNNDYDALVVGSGPNGLAAAITMAREGCTVLLVEAKNTVGGGMRSDELTLPGFVHDVCSAIHPLALASPFFKGLELDKKGLQWILPPAALAHPLDDGSAALLRTSIEDTARTLGQDKKRYARLMYRLTGIILECVVEDHQEGVRLGLDLGNKSLPLAVATGLLDSHDVDAQLGGLQLNPFDHRPSSGAVVT